jgi:energy-coupling factor transporter ATP-binding protein EcfA2
MARSKSGGGRRPTTARWFVERVEIEGYKSIVEQTIELGALNVLVGANGSGKTALLEAIGMLGAAAGGRVDDCELLRSGVRPSVPRLCRSAFADLKRLPRSIKLRAEGPSGHYYSVSLDDPRTRLPHLGASLRRAWVEGRRRSSRGLRAVLLGPRSVETRRSLRSIRSWARLGS